MHSASPCRPTSLPSDIWVVVIQFVDKPTTKSLSLVDKLLREVALPIIFNTLKITTPSCTRSVGSRLYLEDLLRRIHGIGSVPHICNAVRRLNLVSWHIDVLERDTSVDDVHLDTIKLISTVHEAIVQLVSMLPHLYRLDCRSNSITPSLSSVLGSSTLEFLSIRSVPSDLPKAHLTAFPPSLQIFEYHAPFSQQEDIIDLVFAQANQFTSLYVPVHTLARHTDFSATKFHKLQKLTVFDSNQLVPPINGEKLYEFFNFVPNLRELRVIFGFFSVSASPAFSPHTMLPNLESLTAPPSVANDILSFGAPLKKIHIFTTTYPSDFPNDFQIVSKDIKHVLYDGALEDPNVELTHLACMFPNATSVKITLTRERQATHEEIYDAVMDILPNLPHLKQCSVFDLWGPPNDLHKQLTPGFHCPVGRNSDPKYRAHPTLEDVQILSWYRWIWLPEDGWRACDLHYDVAPVDLFRTL